MKRFKCKNRCVSCGVLNTYCTGGHRSCRGARKHTRLLHDVPLLLLCKLRLPSPSSLTGSALIGE